MPTIFLDLNTSFTFQQLSPIQVVNLLDSTYDLSGCIVNCSNKGLCKFDTTKNMFNCECNSDYIIGSACQMDTRPCSLNSCLNNGTCLDYTNNQTFDLELNSNRTYVCLCDKNYEGENCESRIDLCLNFTCSGNGYCVEKDNKPKC